MNLTDAQVKNIALTLCNKKANHMDVTVAQFIKLEEGKALLREMGADKARQVETALLKIMMYTKHKYPIQAVKDALTFNKKKVDIANERGVNRKTICRWEQSFIQEFKKEIMRHG